MTKRIAFLENKLTLRGTTVALYDYADYNERFLNNKSIIITRSYDDVKNSRDVDIKAYNKCSNRFQMIYYKQQSDLHSIIEKNKIDILYITKGGKNNDNLITNKCKTIIHCVFDTDDPHGNYYCGISEFLNTSNKTNIPILHYMISLPNNTNNNRSILNIPDNAIVFGSYGGSDKLVQYVKDAIVSISKNPIYSNIYFIFMNIPAFSSNTNNLRFIQGTYIMEEKKSFINTCDAMIYARELGETFGLACAEFSMCNKRIIANSKPRDKFHIQTLGNDIILHDNYDEFIYILTHFNEYHKDISNNGYKKYTPEFVMEEFKYILDCI